MKLHRKNGMEAIVVGASQTSKHSFHIICAQCTCVWLISIWMWPKTTAIQSQQQQTAIEGIITTDQGIFRSTANNKRWSIAHNTVQRLMAFLCTISSFPFEIFCYCQPFFLSLSLFFPWTAKRSPVFPSPVCSHWTYCHLFISPIGWNVRFQMIPPRNSSGSNSAHWIQQSTTVAFAVA